MRAIFCAAWAMVGLPLFAQAAAPSFAAHVDGLQTVLSPAQRQAMGLPNFPDGSPAIVWDGAHYVFFAAQGEADNSPLAGTIRLVGSLRAPRVHPANAAGDPIPGLRPGLQQPAPGGDFDLDYAGGGTVYVDRPDGALLQVYHGEFDLGTPPSTTTFYTTLGLATSHDFGRHFTKLGPIVSPELPRSAGRTAASSSGSLIRRGGYFYLYYSDIFASASTICGQVPCVAVARAAAADVLSAAEQGKAARWYKYFDGAFSEPGLGGRFTPLFVPSSGEVWARWPVVNYDAYTQSFVMTYAAGLSAGITLRESLDGMSWSDPLYILPAPSGHIINYPGVASATRTPHVLEKQFWVYYRDYPGTTIDFTTSTNADWNRVLVTLDQTPGVASEER